MAGNHRRKSPKERLAEQQTKSFIGRHEQQDLFQLSLLRPDDAKAKIIFSISGQGGVGKTTLLKEFRRIAEDHQHVCAYVDEGMATNRVDDVPEAMHRLAEDLEKQGFKFKNFREHYKAYRVKKQEIEADPEAPKEMLKDAVRGGAKMVLEAGKPMIPVLGSLIDSESIASGVGDAVNYGFERFRNKDEERLMKETLEVLTPLFLEGIKQIPSDKTLVLLLDTYEITGVFLDEWVRSLLDEKFGELERGVLVAIGGRSPIDKNAWTEWESLIARSPLEPFTREEAEQFLASKNIKSAAVIGEIWRLSSGGLPLLVSMMAAAAPTSADAVVDPCEDAVNRFLKWETDGAKRDLALDGACARVLNEDLAAVLGEGQFDWLRSSAFVLRDGGQWRYHSVVREQMGRYLRQLSLQRWGKVHGKLAAFYQTRRQELGLEAGKEAKDKTWREYSLEWIYHELCTAPQTNLGLALNGFLRSLKQSRDLAQDWSETMILAGHESRCTSLKKWGDRLRDGLVARNEERYEDAILALTSLLNEAVIEEKLKAIVFSFRGAWYQQSNKQELALRDLLKAVEIDGEDAECQLDLALTHQNLKDYEEAIESYKKAISLNPEYAIAFGNRGETYRLIKRYDEALQDFDRAIELDDKYDWAIASRGQTYQALKRYDDALQDFDRAIELDNKYAWAIASRGQTYQSLKRYEEALQDFDRAIELDSELGWAISDRGQTYKFLQRYEEAVQDFNRAIELEPTAWKFDQRGETYRLMGRYEEALQDFDRSIELDDKYDWAIGKRGAIYLQTNQVEKSILDFDRAIELNPEAEWTYYLRALAHYKLNQSETATADFQQVIEIAQTAYEKDPTDWQNTFNLATYHLAAGHQEESDRLYSSRLTAPKEWIEMAIDDLDDFLQLFPDHSHAQQVKQRLQGTIHP